MLVAAWVRRWTSDDGLIAIRVAERILGGDGPVINAGERVEASTSVLWPWLLAALGWLPLEMTWVAVWFGALLSMGAVVLGVLGCARFFDDGVRVPVPLGLVVVLAVPAFWDFFTSGLETGLAFFWLAAAWFSLVSAARDPGDTPARHLLLLGLGPLIRPEFGIVTVAFVLVLAGAVRPRRRRLWVWVVAALGPGASYEVFRAGYYGVLVPNPAITKEAGLSNWGQGLWYLGDFVVTYQLWVPLIGVGIIAAGLARSLNRMDAAVLAAPSLAGLLMGGYLVRVGGDFMHARLLLPSLFCLTLPVFVVPWRSRYWLALPLLVVVAWGVVSAATMRPPYSGTETFRGIVDERSQLRTVRGDVAVVTIGDQKRTNRPLIAAADAASAAESLVYVPYDGWREQTYEELEVRKDVGSGVLGAHALGVTSHVAAERGLRVQDLLGLADPVTAHSALVGGRGRPGHEKWLSDAWTIARFAKLGVSAPVEASDVEMARKALACGALAELQDSYLEPMSVSRFLDNIAGSVARTSFRFPSSPKLAVQQLC